MARNIQILIIDVTFNMRGGEIMKQREIVILPECKMCGHNCADGCIYWQPYDRLSSDGRQFCSSFGRYFYPYERNGCFRFKN